MAASKPVVVLSARGVAGAPLKITVPLSWVEDPCERLLETWVKQHGPSGLRLEAQDGTEVPLDWPIEAAVAVYESDDGVLRLWVSGDATADADAAYEAGDFAKAASLYAEAMPFPGCGRARVKRAAACLMIGDFETAASESDRAVEEVEGALRDRALLVGGRARLRSGDFEGADRRFRRVLEAGAAALGDASGEADASLAAELASVSRACFADMRRAARDATAGRHAASAKLAAQVRCRDALGPPGRAKAARIEVCGLAALDNWDACVAVVDDVFEQFRDHPPPGALAGTLDRQVCDAVLKALSFQGRFKDALEMCESWRYEKGRLSSVTRLKSQADAAFGRGDYGAAERTYGDALEQDPGNPVLAANRAAALQSLGRFAEAAASCSVALQRRPFYAKARLRRARCHADKAAAAEDYAAYLRQCPNDARVKAEAAKLQRLPTQHDDAAREAYAEYVAYMNSFFKQKRRPYTSRSSSTTANDQEPSKPTLYECLGVSRDASTADIKKRYRQLALRLHPDRNPAADADDKFRELQQAYETLVDESRRREYDDHTQP